MYLLRFFFRLFSLCYLLSCGILLMILVNYIAYGDGSPPAKFTRIIFVYPSLSDHWYHLLVLEFPNLFRSAFFYFVRFVSCFIIADFSVLFFNWHELWLWWHELLPCDYIRTLKAFLIGGFPVYNSSCLSIETKFLKVITVSKICTVRIFSYISTQI